MNAMKFHNQHEAKQFFIDKILAQAERSNVLLSEAEKYMLKWTELEDGFVVDKNIVAIFNKETTDKTFETKIRGLLAGAFEFDTKGKQKMIETYRNAYNALKKHDHYIMVMINDSIGRNLQTRRKIRDMLWLLVVGLLCSIVIFGGAVFINEKGVSFEWQGFIYWSVVYFAFNVFIVSGLPSINEKWKHPNVILLILFAITIPIAVMFYVFYHGFLEFPNSSWPVVALVMFGAFATAEIISKIIKNMKI